MKFLITILLALLLCSTAWADGPAGSTTTLIAGSNVTIVTNFPGNFTVSSSGGGGPGGGGTNMVPTSLSIVTTNVAIVATQPTGTVGPLLFNLTATTNVFLQVPSGTPLDGQSMIITLTMDAVGTWSLTMDTNSVGGFKGGVDLALPLPVTTNALATDIIGWRYNLAKNKWLVTSHIRGY